MPIKTITCECGHQETGATDNDAVTKMQSHMQSQHADRVSDLKDMMKVAEKTMHEEVAGQ